MTFKRWTNDIFYGQLNALDEIKKDYADMQVVYGSILALDKMIFNSNGVALVCFVNPHGNEYRFTLNSFMKTC